MRIPPPALFVENETSDVLPPVLLHASALGAMVWRQNTGVYHARTTNGWRPVRVCINGCSDILGLVSLSVAHLADLGIPRIGAFLAIETKTKRGRLEDSQLEFRDGVLSRHGLYVVSRGPEDVDKAIAHLLK